MNKGIALCSGELIKLINADDLPTEDSIKTAVEIYTRNENYDKEYFINSHLEIIDNRGYVVDEWGERSFTKYFENALHPSWYVPANLYEKYGPYDLSYSIASDYEYFLRLKANKVSMIMLKTVLARYRRGGASSGLSGVKQVYRLSRKYFGFVRALYVFILHLTGELLSPLKRKLFK
jgi:hypothetical protein